jgi:glycosyltransferase involved in cell wall biosynthesis
MRILAVGNMYPPHHLGGYELIWCAAVEQLRAAGHEVRVLTTDHREPDPDTSVAVDHDVHRELRWYWRGHEFPRMSAPARLRLERHNLATLDRHLGGLEPDVVAWWSMGGMSMSLIEAVHRRGIAAVGLVHDEWLVYGPIVDGWHRLANRRGMPRALLERLSGVPARVDFSAAAEWAFVSETMRRHAAAAGLELERTSVAPSGVDRSLLRPAPMPPWRWRLLYVGRLDSRKGVEIAIRALEHLPEASLRILGSGDERYRDRLRALVGRLGLGGRVEFETVPRDALAAQYERADAVLFPTLWEEPWGLVPLEAMATGTPVVATGSGGSGEYLSHAQNCLLYEPRDDPAALAAQVRVLADDPSLREHLRENGFETAESNDRSRFFAAVGALHERATAGHG